ncbi:DDE_3 domain-containing protein [Trichonephila clavipes]|nr:DDE_3 domain-containing protein [Trichonephila clavipes]
MIGKGSCGPMCSVFSITSCRCQDVSMNKTKENHGFYITFPNSSSWGRQYYSWRMSSWHCMGYLICVDELLNAQEYLRIIVDQVYPILLMVYSDKNGYFQQDNASCHVAGIVCRWFSEHIRHLTLLSWPAQPSDLNPGEIV